MRPFIKSKSGPVVGFCSHVTSTSMFGINLNTLYPNFWSFKEVFSTRTRQSDYTALSPSLSHRSSIILYFGVALDVWKAEVGVLYMPNLMKTNSSHNAEKIAKDL